MILGVGIDIIEVARIESAISNPRFLARIYTASECEAIAQAGNQGAQRAAGYFCAKEAVAKALGVGLVGFGFADIEIVHDDAGTPVCRLYRGAMARFEALGATRILLSISHVASMATALSVIERE